MCKLKILMKYGSIYAVRFNTKIERIIEINNFFFPFDAKAVVLSYNLK